MNTGLVFSVLITVALSDAAPQNNSDVNVVVDTILGAIKAVVLPELESENSNTTSLNVDEVVDSILDAVVGPEGKVEESNITYWFFSKQNPSDGVPLSRQSLSDLDNTSFKTSRDTVFIIHGWMNTNSSPFITTVRQAVVDNVDVNIFVVDWSTIAAQSFIPARKAVPKVGTFLADFIDSLVSSYNLSLSRTSLIGHSLGAHVAGLAGAALNGRIAVIVGLDPARPGFITFGPEDRLDPTDAQFVQVIHTNGGLKGFLSPIGDADYYPNGGMRQPGCGPDNKGSCAHARAYEYYAESLSGGRFLGVSCSSYMEFSDGKCKSGKTSLLGTAHIDTSASGQYYLDTNSESPYAKG